VIFAGFAKGNRTPEVWSASVELKISDKAANGD
jgi:hypothetical protein